MNKVIVFDLDQTVISSEHRVSPCMLSNGDLDLVAYHKLACQPEQVKRDTLLPLSHIMRAYIKSGALVVICTARDMYKHDYQYLIDAGLSTDIILSRDTLVNHFTPTRAAALHNGGDAEYKRAYLSLLQTKYPLHEMVLYDDHQGVLKVARELGIHAVDAIHLNNRIATFNVVGFG